MEAPVVGCCVATVAGTLVAVSSLTFAHTAYATGITTQFVIVSAIYPRWAGLLWPACAAWAVHAVTDVPAKETWWFAAAVTAALAVIGRKLKQ